MPSISHTTSSPGFTFTTPSGVPVRMTSPGASVMKLIEYLSSFMTLSPGDVILTGTPEGVANVQSGDLVECHIEGLGTLANTLVEPPTAATAATAAPSARA